MEEKSNSFSLSVKGKGKIFLKGKKRLFGRSGKYVKTLGDVSDQGLVSIISDKENAEILDKLEVKKNTNESKTEFFKIVSNNPGDFNLKKTKEEIRDRTNIIIRTFSDDIEIINKYDLNKKKLSEDTIDQKNNCRKYVEFYSDGKEKLELNLELNRDGTKNYSFFEYDKEGIRTKKELYFDGNDDFETVKNNNVLSKKTKFALDENYTPEKEFRGMGIVTNVNDIDKFSNSFELPKNIEDKIYREALKKFNCKDLREAGNKISEGKISNSVFISLLNKLYLDARIEILKGSDLKITELGSIEYKIRRKFGRKTEEYNIPKAREFGESDRLRISLDENNKPIFTIDGKPLGKGKHYFTAPNKGGIYIFDNTKKEHHSNFPLDNEKNPDFSVVAAGCFILGEDGKLIKVINDSGHFKPKSKDCTESFLRCASKEMQRTGVECSVTELLSDKIKTQDGGYSLSIDITKCQGDIQGRKNITDDSIEPPEAISVISKRRIDLIDKKTKSTSMNLA